jgi:hypothetical protein
VHTVCTITDVHNYIPGIDIRRSWIDIHRWWPKFFFIDQDRWRTDLHRWPTLKVVSINTYKIFCSRNIINVDYFHRCSSMLLSLFFSDLDRGWKKFRPSSIHIVPYRNISVPWIKLWTSEIVKVFLSNKYFIVYP